MKKTLILKSTIIAFAVMFTINANIAQAKEYQCNISSTQAEGCEKYFEYRDVCPFSDELNIQRTQEAEIGSFTYPDFCSKDCANASNIPAQCRKGLISELSYSEEIVSENIAQNTEMRGGITPRDVHVKSNTVLGRFWNWIVKMYRGDNWTPRPMSTSVAGVRG